MIMTKTPKLPANLWTIVAIHDTRQVEAQGDKIVRIPGSGEMRPCDHCGTGHEVHVTIVNGAEEMIVGTSCARGMSKSAGIKNRTTFVHSAPFIVARSNKTNTWRNPTTGEEFKTER